MSAASPVSARDGHTWVARDTTSAFFAFDRLHGLTGEAPRHAVDELSAPLLRRWLECHLDRLERHFA